MALPTFDILIMKLPYNGIGYWKTNIFRDIFRNTSEIRMAGKISSVYMYDEENDLIHPSSSDILLMAPYKLDNFLKIIYDSHIELALTMKRSYVFNDAHRPYLKLEKMTSIIDFGKIISDLKNLGLVKIEDSDMILATDKRRFVLGVDTYEVDCLGTTFCDDITRVVTDLWIWSCQKTV